MNVTLRIGAAILTVSMIAGCGKPNATSVAVSYSNLFSTGPLEEDWNTVVAAMQTNGYVTAEAMLKKMQLEKPDTKQLDAINNTLRTLNDQLIEAAGNGNTNAINALKESKNIKQQKKTR